MKAKKIIWSILLTLCALVFLADLALMLFVPEQSESTFPGGNLPIPADGAQRIPGSGHPANDSGGEFSSSGNEENLFFTLPDSDQHSSGQQERRGRRDETASGLSSDDAVNEPAAEPAILNRVLAVAVSVRPYALWIVIGSAACMLICIVRLIFLARQSRKLRAQQADFEADDSVPSRKKQAVWPAGLLLLGSLVLVAVLFPADTTVSSNEAVALAEVRSGTVEPGNLTSSLIFAGYLTEQEPVSVSLPVSVELTAVAVQNGDTVEAGQIIAKTDKTSVMKAVAAVQDALAEIDASLQTLKSAKTSATLSAPAAGIVKTVYASVGERAEDVMATHGSLLLLSLDGKMSVDLPAQEGLNAGASLIVTLSDGTTVQGEVTDQSDDMVTVSVYDAGYAVGETVSVSDADGKLYGSGPLSVHRPLNIIGYLGTVSRIYRREGSTVGANAVLIGLTDAANTAKAQELLEQRAEYEAELLELFTLYQNEWILSPADGTVSDVQEDVPYREVSTLFGEDITIRFAATSPDDAVPDEYVHYVGQVTGNAGGTLSLNISFGSVTVTDYTDLSSLASAEMSLEGSYTIPSTVPVYTYSGTWETMPSSSIAAGDLVVFAFDETGTLVWVICCPGAAPTPTPSPTPTPTPTPDPSATPGSGARPSSSPSQGGSHGSSGGHGSGGSIRIPSASGGGSQSQKQAYVIGKQTLLSVIPQETMTLTVSVDELDILTISVGQKVLVYLDALPGVHFEGTITEIDPEGANSGGNTKYNVTVAVPRTSSMRAGMNAAVLLMQKTEDHVLTIPLAALNENGNLVTVYTAYDLETDTLLNPVPVTTGLSDGENVEILSGLTAGDSYYYRYADSIAYQTE